MSNGLEAIREFYRDFARSDSTEQSGEIQSLEAWLKELRDRSTQKRTKRSLNAREKLEHALSEAVLREDYESAAKYRDACTTSGEISTTSAWETGCASAEPSVTPLPNPMMHTCCGFE